LIEFPKTRPTHDELLSDDDARTRLSGYLIAQHVDRVRSEVRDGSGRVEFHFEHRGTR